MADLMPERSIDVGPLALMGVPFVVEPLRWPPGKARRRPDQREAAKFRAGWSDTLTRLVGELEKLRPVRVRLSLDIPAGMVRRDGLPRADARLSDPSVVLWVETEPTRWMHLPCDTYTDWRDNVRAIALTMEDLRAAERRGVLSGEQYEGLRQIPAVTGIPGVTSPREAAAFIATHAQKWDASGPAESLVALILADASVRETYYRKAAARLHPDARETGSAELFDRLTRARAALDRREQPDEAPSVAGLVGR